MRSRAARLRLLASLAAALALALSALSAVALARPITEPPPSPPPATGSGPSSPAVGTSETQVANGSSDVLSANGFQSYDCTSDAGGLTARQQADCATSGAAWQPEPLGNYLFDIHINTGITAWGADVAAGFENLVLTPIWLAIVYALHGILIAVSWALELNILSGAMPGIAHALATGRQIFTNPWMTSALAIAAVGLLWHGLGRRGVSQSLGGALAMAAMIICALALIADPEGTIGEASSLVNQASLGTAVAAAADDPSAGASSFDTALARVFDQAIADPFAVLEFGDLKWAHGLDPKVAAARAEVLRSSPQDVSGGNTAALRAASDNAEIFLAFNSNGNTRNGMNSGKLMQAICGSYSDDADSCQGTATTPKSVPQFRSSDSVWQRTAALMLIIVGSLGEILTFAYVAYRLILAALMALVLLLLAPLMVLAPAFGETGRQVFKKWGARLLGAVLAKLVYAFFLGVLLLSVRVLGEFSTGAFFVQFALLAAFWWGVFLHRHQITQFTAAPNDQAGTRAIYGLALLSRAQRSTRALRRPRPGAQHSARRGGAGTGAIRGQERLRAAHDVAGAQRTAMAEHSLGHELRGHEERLAASGAAGERLRAQERRLHDRARGACDPRERARVQARLERVREQLAPIEESRGIVARADASRAQTGSPFSAAQLREREQLLRANAEFPAGTGTAEQVRAGRARDYQRLAPVAGHSPAEYQQAPRAQQLQIRREVDERLERYRQHDRVASLEGAEADPRQVRRYVASAEASAQSRRPLALLPVPGALRPTPPPADSGELGRVAHEVRDRTRERARARTARERQFGRGRGR